MATIIKKEECDFQPNPNKIDSFRLLSDVSRLKKGINPKYLNFDIRQLNPGEYNAPYHFHRFAEELFFILTGTVTLRTPNGLEIVNVGDLIFFESGASGAHQIYNHADEPCTYLDMRSYMGYDVCEYPDSDKIIIVPEAEIFRKGEQVPYFEGETNIKAVWAKLLENREWRNS